MSYNTTPSPIIVNNTKTLNANNTTASVAIFQLTGAVRAIKIYGVVTTLIGSNHTGSNFLLTDGTNAAQITGNATTPLSAAPVGSLVVAVSTSANPTLVVKATQCVVGQPTSAGLPIFQESELVSLNSVSTNYIIYQYTTTDAPTSGAIQFFVEYQPLSANGLLVPV